MATKKQPLSFGMELVHQGPDVHLVAFRGAATDTTSNAAIRTLGVWELSQAALERATNWLARHPGQDPTIADAKRWLDDDCTLVHAPGQSVDDEP